MLIRFKMTPRSVFKMWGWGVSLKWCTCALRPTSFEAKQMYRGSAHPLFSRTHSASSFPFIFSFKLLSKPMYDPPTPLSLSLSLSLPLSFKKNLGSWAFTEIKHIFLYYVYKNAFPPKWQCVLSQSCLRVPELVTCRVSTSSFLPSFMPPFLLML